MIDDWRYTHLQTQPFLIGVSFVRKTYGAFRPGWKHDHCVGCGAKLAEPGSDGEEILHEGYATTSDYVHGVNYDWVCVACFEQFHGVMNWKDVTPCA